MRQMYYINPSIQKSFTTLFTLLTVLELLLFGLALFIISYLDFFKFHEYKIYYSFALILTFLLLISGLNLWLGMRLSHRFVGPIVQLSRTLDQAIAGKYHSRISLRSNDFLQDIGDKLNQLLDKLEKVQLDYSQVQNKNPNDITINSGGVL